MYNKLSLLTISILFIAGCGQIPVGKSDIEKPFKQIVISDIVIDDIYPANQFKELYTDIALFEQIKAQGIEIQGKDLHDAITKALKKGNVKDYRVIEKGEKGENITIKNVK